MSVAIKVSVNKAGVVLHTHDGCPTPHDPNRAHDRDTIMHDAIGRAALLKPVNLGELAPALQAQYASALRTKEDQGKTFWVYPVKKADAVASRDAAEFPLELR